VRFRVDIEDVQRHFRLLLLAPDAPLGARALATLPQVYRLELTCCKLISD